MSKSHEGFSLLEIMLASLVLMIGMMAIAQLNRSLLSAGAQSRESRPDPTIVENLLREQVEYARSVTSQAQVVPLSAFVTPEGTYSFKVFKAEPPLMEDGLDNGTESGTTLRRVRYATTVLYQGPGMTQAATAGVVVFDKITGMTSWPGRSGL